MSKQETFSVSEIKRLCAATEYLDESDIHEGDRTVSFDGNIIYYQNKKPKAKGREILIPIQIKGKEYKKLPTKSTISYPVSMFHINNYFRNGGVIYFVVAMERKTYALKTYAKILLPIDIQEIKIGKEKQESISITLSEINGPNDLVMLCDLFAQNSLKQSLVILGVPTPNPSSIREFNFSTVKSKYTDPAIAIAKSPIKYIYAKQHGIEIPISMSGIMTSKDSHFLITAGDFKHVFPVKHVYSQDKTVTTINDIINITLEEKKGKVLFSLLNYSSVRFDKTYKIAELLLNLSKSDDVAINGVPLFKNTTNLFRKKMSKDFIQFHEYLLEIGELLNSLKVPMSNFLTKEAFESRETLLILKEALINHKTVSLNAENDFGIYYQKVGGKGIILEYEKNEDGQFLICDYLKDGKRIGIFDGYSENPQQISKWFSIAPEKISDTIFDREQMIKDLSKSENNKDMDYLTLFVLALINDYDCRKLEEFLDFAIQLQDIIEIKQPGTDANFINRMQINYRRGALSPKQKHELEKLKAKTGDLAVICCACILLKQYDEFKVHFKELAQSKQEEFKKWPIYQLFTTQPGNVA